MWQPCAPLRSPSASSTAEGGFVTLPADDLVALTQRVRAAGLKAKPEVGIQFGAGGASAVETLEARGTREVDQAIELAKRHLDAGAT